MQSQSRLLAAILLRFVAREVRGNSSQLDCLSVFCSHLIEVIAF